MLVRAMPVLAAARIIEITDKRLWRIVQQYVGRAVEHLDLSKLAAVGLDETAAKPGHIYVTLFIDLDRSKQPVAFVTPGRGNQTVVQFRAFLAEHGIAARKSVTSFAEPGRPPPPTSLFFAVLE